MVEKHQITTVPRS